MEKIKYEPPVVITYSGEEILEDLGPIEGCIYFEPPM